MKMDSTIGFVLFAIISHVCVGQMTECKTELRNCLKIAGDDAGVDVTSIEDIGKLNKETACKYIKGLIDCINDIKPPGKCDQDKDFSNIATSANVAFNAQNCDGSENGSECQRIELPKCFQIGGNAIGLDITPDNIGQFIGDKTIFCKFAKGFKDCVKNNITPQGKCDADQGFSVMAQSIETQFKNHKCGCGSLGASIVLLIASVWFLLGQRKV